MLISINCALLSECNDARVDMVFVLDASTSVTEDNFELMKDFLKYFLSTAPIDNGNVRVGVIIYSTADYLQFHLNAYSNSLELFDAIDFIPYRYGSTNTADALKTMRTEMFTAANGDRPDVENIAIVITDGVSNINARRTIPEADEARKAGIHIYAIGIGLTDTKELDGIASKPLEENRFTVQDFAELRDIRTTIFEALCKRKFDQFQYLWFCMKSDLLPKLVWYESYVNFNAIIFNFDSTDYLEDCHLYIFNIF